MGFCLDIHVHTDFILLLYLSLYQYRVAFYTTLYTFPAAYLVVVDLQTN